MDVESDTAGASSAFSKHTTRALLTRIWMEWGAGSWQAHILYTFVCLFQTVDLFILSQWAHVKQGKWMSDSESRRMWERAQASKEQGRASVVVWFFFFCFHCGASCISNCYCCCVLISVAFSLLWFSLLFRFVVLSASWPGTRYKDNNLTFETTEWTLAAAREHLHTEYINLSLANPNISLHFNAAAIINSLDKFLPNDDNYTASIGLTNEPMPITAHSLFAIWNELYVGIF